MEAVYDTLKQLGANESPIITAFNKIDLLNGDEILKDPNAEAVVRISGKNGEGTDQLLEQIEKILQKQKLYLEKLYGYQEAGKIQLIRSHGQLLKEEYRDDGIYVEAYIPKRDSWKYLGGEKVIIQKVINNNVVSTFDSNGKEVILMGKGIGFRKKTGDELDKTKIEKIFTLDLSGKSSFVQEVMAIIQEFYEIVLDTEHPAYQRFATHLQYLETEILSKKRPIEEDEEDDVEFYERNQKKYPEAYVCSQKIVEHIEQHYNCKLSADEKMYLIIYVKRLILEMGHQS